MAKNVEAKKVRSVGEWRPVVNDLKERINKLKDGETPSIAYDLLQVVERLESVLTTDSGPVHRQQWPKRFSIGRIGDSPCLHETIVGSSQPPLYCLPGYHKAICEAIVNFIKRDEEFTRDGLTEEARKINPRVTKPAVIACVRFWMSIEDPLIKKNAKSNNYDSTVDGDVFSNDAKEELEKLADNPFTLDAPRTS